MRKHQNETKDIFVTIILTESTSSLLSLDLPHIEQTHPKNSRICVITDTELKALKHQQRDEEPSPGTPVGCGLDNFQIASTVALFSISNCSSNSELYETSESLSDPSCSAHSTSTERFKKADVVRYPLVSVRSMAHANKLQLENNNIYVTLLDSESRMSGDVICRICHGGQSIDDLLTPCRCRGTIALVHLKCLERWLKESNHSSCELCQHHFRIIREPQYSVPWSILVFLRHPGLHLKEIILDMMAFSIYTPSAVASTYMLMLICEALVKNSIVTTGSLSSHIIAFSAVFGMAAIDFTYSSWLIMTMQKHIDAWRDWYNSHSKIKVILPKIKMRPYKKKKQK